MKNGRSLNKQKVIVQKKRFLLQKKRSGSLETKIMSVPVECCPNIEMNKICFLQSKKMSASLPN